jgi:hypothetical protein
MRVSPQDSVFLVTSEHRDNQQFGSAFAFYWDEGAIGESQAVYFLTCRHVVDNVGGQDQVLVGNHRAELVSGTDDDLPDLAVLRVENLREVPILWLDATAAMGSRVSVLGFQLFTTEGLHLIRPLQGQLGAQVGVLPKGIAGRVVAWDLTINGDYDLEHGYSGGPVIDEQSGCVVAVANYRVGGKKGVAISIEAVEEVWPGAMERAQKVVDATTALVSSLEHSDRQTSVRNEAANIKISNEARQLTESQSNFLRTFLTQCGKDCIGNKFRLVREGSTKIAERNYLRIHIDVPDRTLLGLARLGYLKVYGDPPAIELSSKASEILTESIK